jgi:hypothetical protein
VLDSIHDLPRPGPQVALGDLGISSHFFRLALGAIECYSPGASAAVTSACQRSIVASMIIRRP